MKSVENVNGLNVVENVEVTENASKEVCKIDSVTTTEELTWGRAEELRKNGRYEEALSYFQQHFNQQHDENSLWRIVFCARKNHDYQFATSFLEEHYNEHPRSKMLRLQLAWLKHDTVLAELQKKNDNIGVIKVCEEILDLNDELGSPLFNSTYFAAIDAAKASNNYPKLLELTDMIGPDKFPELRNSNKGKKPMSYRERWFFARLQGLFGSLLFKECRELALDAAKIFHGKIEFQRRAALCLLKLGNPRGAEEELTKLSTVRGCPWYLLSDLAELRFGIGKFFDALDAAFTAATMFGELRTKVNLFALIARIQLVLGDSDSARNHAMLSVSIRQKEGWKINQDCISLINRFGFSENLPVPEICLKACSDEWKSLGYGKQQANHSKNDKTQKSENTNATVSKTVVETGATGVIIAYQEGRPFAFINSHSFKDKIYVKVADIPEELRKDGTEVCFDVYESFDYVKNKKGLKAANISKLEKVEALAA